MGSCESLDVSNPWDDMRHKGFILNIQFKYHLHLKMMTSIRIFDIKTFDSNITLISIWGNKNLFKWKGDFPFKKDDIMDILFYTKTNKSYKVHYITQLIYNKQLYTSSYYKLK